MHMFCFSMYIRIKYKRSWLPLSFIQLLYSQYAYSMYCFINLLILHNLSFNVSPSILSKSPIIYPISILMHVYFNNIVINCNVCTYWILRYNYDKAILFLSLCDNDWIMASAACGLKKT